MYLDTKGFNKVQIKKDEVKNKILESAKKEFLEHGYQGASLRTIAKNLGLTKGALYPYFKNKEDIFTALVKGPAENLYQYMKKMQEEALSQDLSSQVDYANNEGPAQDDSWVNYIYDNMDVFRLIALNSKGTKYQDFFSDLANLEKKSTLRYIENMREAKALYYDPDDMLVHILIDITIKSLISIIENDIPRDKGLIYWRKMEEFYFAGWKKLLFNL